MIWSLPTYWFGSEMNIDIIYELISTVVYISLKMFSIFESKLGTLGFDISIHSFGLGSWRKSIGPL